MENSGRIPVALLTGFLGSGKTTLLRRLLTDPGMSKAAVLINEFGEISLDHLFVREVMEGAVVLQNGCVCCTLRTDLQEGLRDLIDKGVVGGPSDFDRVVIETTGLADPAPIAQTLLLDPMLRHRVRLANIVTTVDGMHGAGQLSTHREALRQAAIADRIVVTKTDLIPTERLKDLSRALKRLNPTARVFDVHANNFDAALLLVQGVADPATKLQEVEHWLQSHADDHDHDGHEEDHPHHEHERGHLHSDGIRSFSIRLEEQVDWTIFGVWLTLLLHRHGDKVLRVKGLLNVSDALGPMALHGVQHVIHPPVHLERWPDDDRTSRIVFIVEGIEPAALEQSLRTFLAAGA